MMQVRIAAVDAPETAHFGAKGQPFGEEATQYVKDLVLGKVVKLQLFSRDQYSRVVAMVHYPDFRLFPPRRRSNLSLELLRKGLGVVYRQGGAQYGGMLEEFERVEKEAKRKKRGL